MSPPSRKYDIDFLIEEVVTLPSLPGTVATIMRLVNDPQCSLSAVAKAISADPPLAMKTLRLVNTAYYGLRQKITTIEHAVVLLGTKVVKNLAFTATVFDIMKGSVEGFFRHSVSCAMATRALVEASAAKTPTESADEAFVFGLLHDIGKVVFEQFLPNECREVARLAQEQRIPWYVAEREIIGVDHALLGAKLAEKWKLPAHLIDGIGGHHSLGQCQHQEMKPIAALVSVGDYMVTQCAIPAADGSIVQLNDEVWKRCGLASADMPGIVDSFLLKLPSVEELMQIAS